MYLGQTNKSVDKVNRIIAKDIASGLTFNSKRLLENNIKENRTKIRLKAIKAFCHSAPKDNFDSAIKKIGNI